MNDQDDRRDARAIVRTYKDTDGKDKNIYQTIGTAWVSPHGSTVTIQLETLPISKDWNGKIYINEPYEKKEPQSESHAFNKKVHDKLPDDDAILQLKEIPF